MTCDDIKDILKGDYLDGELSVQEREFVARHLAQCAACRVFEEDLQAQRRIFQQAVYKKPPAQIWNNVQAAIEKEQIAQERSVKGRLISFFEILFAPRPFFALGSAFAIVFLVITLTIGLRFNQQQLSHAESLTNFVSYDVRMENSDFVSDFGTNIEKFLL